MRGEEAEKRIVETLRAIASLSGGGLHELTGIPIGALYPALSRLEESGVIASEWEAPVPRQDGRPRRRLYSMIR